MANAKTKLDSFVFQYIIFLTIIIFGNIWYFLVFKQKFNFFNDDEEIIFFMGCVTIVLLFMFFYFIPDIKTKSVFIKRFDQLILLWGKPIFYTFWMILPLLSINAFLDYEESYEIIIWISLIIFLLLLILYIKKEYNIVEWVSKYMYIISKNLTYQRRI